MHNLRLEKPEKVPGSKRSARYTGSASAPAFRRVSAGAARAFAGEALIDSSHRRKSHVLGRHFRFEHRFVHFAQHCCAPYECRRDAGSKQSTRPGHCAIGCDWQWRSEECAGYGAAAGERASDSAPAYWRPQHRLPRRARAGRRQRFCKCRAGASGRIQCCQAAFGPDPQPGGYYEVTSVTDPCDPAGSVGFDPPLQHAVIGSGWLSWSHGYTGDVYYSGGALSVTISISFAFPPAYAFYFYTEPNPFSDQTFVVTADDGTSTTFRANGSGGAAFCGVVGVVQTLTVECTTGNDFAIGEFGVLKWQRLNSPAGKRDLRLEREARRAPVNGSRAVY
jgi:hypothetical protein